MRCIKLEVEYDGGKFFGFQKQRNQRTVQESLEKAIQEICQKTSSVIGAGRTDAGVHAFGQVCHFKTPSLIPCENLFKGLNSILAPDIVIKKVTDVSENFHARYSAIGRSYCYLILNRFYPSAFLDPYSHWIPQPLNVDLMKSACQYFVGKQDYSGFKGAGSGEKNNVVWVKKVFCFRSAESSVFFSLEMHPFFFSDFSQDIIFFYIEADRFLYHMVRNIMGTLIEIGLEKRAPDDVKKILVSKNRKLAGPTVSPKGLFLLKVFY